MIIRSQDKKRITTDLNLYIEPRENGAIGNVTCWIKNNTMGIMGSYSSWEKAIKVLDMIQEAYAKMRRNDCIIRGSMKELSLLPEKETETYLKDFKNVYYFNMPQDDDVN